MTHTRTTAYGAVCEKTVTQSNLSAQRRKTVREDNRVRCEDQGVHNWYRFVLSFPPHLVQDYLARLDVKASEMVLDPFCGTGTTLVECKKIGIRSVGLEANPMAAFACRVKLDWTIDPEQLLLVAEEIAHDANVELEAQGFRELGLPIQIPPGVRPRAGLRSLPPESMKLLLKNSISPIPLHRVLVLRDAIEKRREEKCYECLRLALAKALVFEISNLHFGPEVGVQKPKYDAPAITSWLSAVRTMVSDLRSVRDLPQAEASVYHSDSRFPLVSLEPKSVDAVITSPPYPNEKDYTRTTRLESVILEFHHSMSDVRAMKKSLVRSNTRGVYVTDDDHLLVEGHAEIDRIASAIESRRIQLGKTSGFERLYHRVTKLYFGGMARHLAELRAVLRPGARLAYVVGDQASYLRVMIRTGQLLADIAKGLGYEVIGIDLFRTRLATATREQLREEVLLLRWTGRTAR